MYPLHQRFIAWGLARGSGPLADLDSLQAYFRAGGGAQRAGHYSALCRHT
jgi:hypothetical protein